MNTGQSAKPTLLELAKVQFASRSLSRAEEKIFKAAQAGEAASELTGKDADDDPADAANWQAERGVQAECIQWLCTNPQAAALVPHRGIQIWGMRIDGDLDLGFAQIPFPVQTWKCAFSGNIVLRHARLPALYLQRSHLRHLNADGAEIAGNVYLRNSFKAAGEVNLIGATIGGSLDCEGAELTNAKGTALHANRAKIGGSVFLRNDFKASGEVNFRGATIEGGLDCEAAEFANAEGNALNADGAKIAGDVFLRNSFKAAGEVNLLGATIGGTLDCERAELTNGKGTALQANRAKIGGSVFFRNGFKASGEVNFRGATIEGGLDCEAAEFANAEGNALNADGAKIAGDVFLRNSFKAAGEVNLLGATIGGTLDCKGAELTNAKGTALQANRAKIGGSVFLRNGFKASGEVNFRVGTIGGNLVCDGAEFTNAKGEALSADGTKITGSVFLRNFKADGRLIFDSAEIGKYFIWSGVESPEKAVLDLRSAKVGTLWDDEKSWPAKENLLLNGFTYDRIFEGAPQDAASRIEWLHRQAQEKFLPQPYEQLASVLRAMGHERQARKVLIQKNRDYAHFTRRFSQEWWWYNVFGKLIGHGYKPWQAFVISLMMIVIGAVLFQIGYSREIITPAKENAYAKDTNGRVALVNGKRMLSEDYPKFNPFVYSLESFTPLLKLDQSENWKPNANLGAQFDFGKVMMPKTGSLLRTYLWIHIIAGWVLTSLWVGALTGLAKT